MKNTKTTTTKNPAIKNDYQMNQEIANKIIEIIENEDIGAWRKTWTTTSGLNIKNIYDLVVDGFCAINLYSMQQYSPLMIPAGFYVTFKQIKDHKLHLTKGAKGVANYKPCNFVKYLTQNEKEAFNLLLENKEELKEEIKELMSGKKKCGVRVVFEYIDTRNNKKVFDEILFWESKKQEFYYKKFQYVLEYLFNACDCGLSLEDIKTMWKVEEVKPEDIKDLTRIEKVEEVKNSYIDRAKLKFDEVQQNRAYYMPATHSVVIPCKNQFETIEDYYQTMLHEFAHSTGHESLLNRRTLTASCGFGSTTYSKEELVAELSSLYTMISLNLMNDELLRNSIAYLKGWGDGLKDGIKHNILNTISLSRKATNLILNLQD